MLPQMSVEREQVEREVRAQCEGGAMTKAAEIAVRGYGPEILGFLHAFLRREDDADDVFSLWCERILRGLPKFGWACSLRTFAYANARNAASNYARDKRARERRVRPNLQTTELSAIEQQVRTETRPYLRTEAKSKLEELRDALAPDDRMLLVLRLDKGLEWKDVARVMLGEEASGDATALTREAQRLRKRFQIVKEELVEAGRRAGLLGDA
ncbi:RNA polymerase, sigma-24 subunit, ECF subfamily protein [Minicystis rosea]|nr:RNA polymerase, sigma-24 subunit, ECF subfamily protein [Minicystis rosea]